MDEKGPSPHLSWAELACHDAAKTPYPFEWRADRAVKLAAEFEWIRARFGNRPIKVGSGYRTEAHNRRIGGAKKSQHVQGKALDLYPPEGVHLEDFIIVVSKYAKSEKSLIGGIGKYPNFMHIDIRDFNHHVIVWQGDRVWAESKV